MPSPLLRTKLYIPQVRRGLVPRPRLDDRLNRNSRPRLTLISAPPGFGKTTLLAAWLNAVTAAERPVAWVSLEESERQPESFWTYVVTALDAAAPGVGAGALTLLQAANPPIDVVLATVLNELGALPAGLDLVLDDYHLADAPAIARDMTFVLEHLPEHVHLVISTRADPALPLAGLRARGELLEVRAADLRFTLDEVAAYFNEVIGLELDAADVAALEGRTEGWIAALQLAALSLQGRDDVGGFIAGFAGDDRYVVDYLVEEVLARQPDVVRRFLLQTSILDRLSGPLCDAVTGEKGGKAALEMLDRSNLFVVPLDDSRQWYRYHHLFADVLRTHLLEERPGEVAELHRRAGRWYDATGEPVAAVRHTLAAGDVADAADTVTSSPCTARAMVRSAWKAVADRSPRIRARAARYISIAPGRRASSVLSTTTISTDGSLPAVSSSRSTSSSRLSIPAKSPLDMSAPTKPTASTGRTATTSWGKSSSQRRAVASRRSRRRLRMARSTRSAASVTSPAARVCRTAATGSPAAADHRPARRCSSATSPGRSSSRWVRRTSAKRWW